MVPKIPTLFYLFFCGLLVKSQTNSLVIFSEYGQTFNLTVNHELVNKTPQSNVKVFNLNTGWNSIELNVTGESKELKLTDSILVSATSKFPDKEFTYVLLEKEGKLHLKFKEVSEHSGPETPPVPEAPKEVVPLVDNNLYGNLYQAVKNKPVFFDNYDEGTSTCKIILTDKEIKFALNLMFKVNDKETAYRYLNQMLENNCYTVLQLKELLEVVTIDMDKLNSAKKAYFHVCDPENIRVLLNLFRYPAMKESFISFLNEQENINKQKRLQCKVPISSSKLDEIYNKIRNTPYENEKIILAKKIMVDVCLSSIQAKKISELITHDREKNELLKSAFYILTDKENAISLAEEFQFKEAKEEFLKFISSQK